MKGLQEEFNALSGKIVRIDEFKTLSKQMADARYKGIKGKINWIKESIANLAALPVLVSKFIIALKNNSEYPPVPSEVYVENGYFSSGDDKTYVSAVSLLKSFEAVTGEKVLAQSIILEAVKQCPDHKLKLNNGLIHRL
jgi:hypothetical protein